MNPTIPQACAALAPEDELDFALEVGDEISKGDREILLGRKHACVSAALKTVSTLCQVLDDEDEDQPNRQIATAYLSTVAAWVEKPSDTALTKVKDALGRSNLVSRQVAPAMEGKESKTVTRADCYDSKLTKCVYHAFMACLSVKPSDAASHLRAVVGTAAQGIELATGQASGYAHGRLIGIVQAEGL